MRIPTTICFVLKLTSFSIHAELPIRSTKVDYDSCAWTEVFSSEHDGTMDCPQNQVAAGIDCQGRYCSSKRLWCCDLLGTIDGRGQAYWLEPLVTVSDEINRRTTAYQLEEHHFLTGLQCMGTNCASLFARSHSFAYGILDISYVENAELERKTYRDGCEWTDWLKSGEMKCLDNRAIAALDCTGVHCSKVKVQCCSFGRVCPIGQYGDNIECRDCPRGKYGRAYGLVNYLCSGECPTGRYGAVTGLKTSFCSNDCPVGRYLPTEGSESVEDCIYCPKGRYGQTVALSTSECTAQCPVGKYRDLVGGVTEHDCTYCPSGTYGTTVGLQTSACSGSCDPGKYSSEQGASLSSTCIACPTHYYDWQCRPSDTLELGTDDKASINVYGESNLDEGDGPYTGDKNY